MNGLDTKEWDPAVDRIFAQSACFDGAAALATGPSLTSIRWCRGIMNGLDPKEWDPAVDRFLPQSARFDGAAGLAEAKAHAKALLQKEQGLYQDPEVQF